MEDSFKSNVPYKILYDNYIFRYEGLNPKKKKKITWHCQNYRKIKDLPEGVGKFCNSTIQGFRNNLKQKKFKFYLKNNHSDRCKKFQNILNISKDKEDVKNIKSEVIIDSELLNRKDFNLVLEDYIKNNKDIKIDFQSFIKYGLKIYTRNNLKETSMNMLKNYLMMNFFADMLLLNNLSLMIKNTLNIKL